MIDNRSPVYYKKIFKIKNTEILKIERLLNFYFIKKGFHSRYEQIIQLMFTESIVKQSYQCHRRFKIFLYMACRILKASTLLTVYKNKPSSKNWKISTLHKKKKQNQQILIFSIGSNNFENKAQFKTTNTCVLQMLHVC